MNVQWQPQRRPRACLSGSVNSKLSLYFKISRTPCVSCQCLPFNLEKMAAVLVTVFKENMVLCRGRFLWVSDMSLLSMLQGLLSTSEMSESVAGCLHSVLQQQVCRESVLTWLQTIKFLYMWSLGGAMFSSIYAILRTWRTRTPQLAYKISKEKRPLASPKNFEPC